MIRAFRIVKNKYLDSAFDGEGSMIFGGRWNSRGRRLVYTSGSLALALLEILVGIQDDEMLEEYSYVSAEFDPELVLKLDDLAKLSATWASYPSGGETRRIGDNWIDAKLSAVLCVPSVIVAAEPNYLINPEHPDFNRIIVGEPSKFEFDERLRR